MSMSVPLMHAFSTNTVDIFSMFSFCTLGISSLEIHVADWWFRGIDLNLVPDHCIFGGKTHTEHHQQPNPGFKIPKQLGGIIGLCDAHPNRDYLRQALIHTQIGKA